MRRSLERERRRYWNRQQFSRAEYVEANTRAYLYGIGIAILAARDVLGLGKTRLNRVAERITEYHKQVFGDDLEAKALPVAWLLDEGEEDDEGGTT